MKVIPWKKKYTGLDPYKLTLLPPADFQTPDEMMNTTAIRSVSPFYYELYQELQAKILDLIVGNENDVLETDCYGTANIDIGIDDSFLRKMIDDKKMAFHSNAKSKVTPEFLMNYITVRDSCSSCSILSRVVLMADSPCTH